MLTEGNKRKGFAVPLLQYEFKSQLESHTQKLRKSILVRSENYLLMRHPVVALVIFSIDYFNLNILLSSLR